MRSSAEGQILESAIALFVAHGYRATTIKAVVNHAKASSALFCKAFGSKQAHFAESIYAALQLLAEPAPPCPQASQASKSSKSSQQAQDSALLIAQALADREWRGVTLHALERINGRQVQPCARLRIVELSDFRHTPQISAAHIKY